MKKTYIIPTLKCAVVEFENMIAGAGSIKMIPTEGEESGSANEGEDEVKAQRGGLWNNEW